MPKQVVHFQSCHESGNIFRIMSKVRNILRKEHRITEWNNAWERIQRTDYAGALEILREFVDLVDDDGRC